MCAKFHCDQLSMSSITALQIFIEFRIWSKYRQWAMAWSTHHMASYTIAIIGSGHDLSPVWHQTITWASTYVLSVGPSQANFGEIWIKMLTIYFRPQSVKTQHKLNFKFTIHLSYSLWHGDHPSKLLHHPSHSMQLLWKFWHSDSNIASDQ